MTSPTEPFRLRVATAADLAVVAAVEGDADRRFAQAGLGQILDLDPVAAEPATEQAGAGLEGAVARNRLVVAVDGSQAEEPVVAFAWWSVLDGDAHLEQVSVTVEAAGRRLGRQLIDWVADQARADGFRALTLTTFADVPWNGPLYRTYGFAVSEPATLGPELSARRQHERRIGLDVLPRVAMRRPL